MTERQPSAAEVQNTLRESHRIREQFRRAKGEMDRVIADARSRLEQSRRFLQTWKSP